MTDGPSSPDLGKKRLSRRDFLKLASLALGGGLGAWGIGRAAMAYLDRKYGQVANAEAAPQSEFLRINTLSVGELLANSGDDEALRTGVSKTASEIYGLNEIQKDDWVLIVPKPSEGQAIVLTMNGVAASEAGKGKKGAQGALEIRFQRKSDTSADSTIEDRTHPDADVVQRVDGTNGFFYPLSAGWENDQHGFKGWGEIPFADGQPRPVITSLAETQDKLLLYMPVTSLQNAKYPQQITNFSGRLAELSFPAADR